MAAIKMPLREVTQESRNFTVDVTQESLLPETTSLSGDVKYQKLLFIDKEGTEISATLFDEDIELYSEVFHEGREYEITNSVITPIREDMRRGSQDFQMIIRSQTKVVELPHATVEKHSYIVPLDSCIKHVGHQGRIDIIGVAIHVTSSRKVRPKHRDTEFDARDIVLVDRSMKPSTLTVWQAFVSDEAQAISEIVDSRPTILATRVAASTFGGGSWNTTFFSTIQLDCADSEAIALRQWEKDNAAKIAEIAKGLHVNESEGNTQGSSSQIESTRTVLPIAALGLQADGATVWVKGRVTRVINPDKCIYASCSVCTNKTEAEISEKFSCVHTKVPHKGTSVYRCNLQIRFEDESSAIKLTLFHELADKVLKRTAEQISCLSHEERLSLVSDFVDSIRTRLFTVQLVAKQYGVSKKHLRFRAHNVEEISE